MAATLSFLDANDPGFHLVSYELRDDMSRLFNLDLLVQSTDAGLEMASLVGRRVALDLGPGIQLPRVTGILREVKVVSTEASGVSRYLLYIVPPLWLTTRRINHRIFQDRTAVEIVDDVLVDYGGRIAAPIKRLGGSYRKRSYCAQYGESDHDFIFRLLADEGIATCFDHTAGSQWVLVDQTDSLTPRHDAPIPYVEPTLGNEPPVPSVSAVVVTAKIKTSAVAVRDYDHLNPSFTIQARSTAEGAELFVEENELEAYTFEVGGRLRLTRRPDKYAGLEQVLMHLAVDDGLHAAAQVKENGILLRGDERDSLAPYKAAVAALCPWLRLSGVEPRDGAAAVWFERENGARVELYSLSHGEQQAVLLALAHVLFGLRRALVLIDEPELHIHPSEQLRFLNALAGLGEDNQIIAATASKELLGSAPRHQVVVPAQRGR